MQYISFQENQIAFRDSQSGNTTLVLLHGFMESSEIWGSFEHLLTENYRVVTIDLPGHGQTRQFAADFSMLHMAQAVAAVTQGLRLEKFHLIGHSMGGYVALEFLKQFPEKLHTLTLLHSSPFADNELKKAGRDATIMRLKNGRKNQIISEHFPNVFAPDNREKFNQIINAACEQATANMSANSIISSLLAMKHRQDYNHLLSQTNVPLIYIQGLKDNFIAPDTFQKISKPKQSYCIELQKSGHAGFLEQTDELIKHWRALI